MALLVGYKLRRGVICPGDTTGEVVASDHILRVNQRYFKEKIFDSNKSAARNRHQDS